MFFSDSSLDLININILLVTIQQQNFFDKRLKNSNLNHAFTYKSNFYYVWILEAAKIRCHFQKNSRLENDPQQTQIECTP